MVHRRGRRDAAAGALVVALVVALVLAACTQGGSRDERSAPAVVADRSLTIVPLGPNAVSTWADIAARTINASSPVQTTAEERRTAYTSDMATVQVAVFDALAAIDGRYRPDAATPVDAAPGASMPAAIAAATRGVLRALFPNRSDQFEPDYARVVGAIPESDAKTRGIAIGSQAAAVVVARRADDGRSVVLAPYVPGSEPGKFRGTDPLNRFLPFIKPFALTRIDQFRPGGPPALSSVAYAADFAETKSLGGLTSTTRTADQLEAARFNTETPSLYTTRNIDRLAQSTSDLPEAARLLALMYVVLADTTNACFEAKYHYAFWRPLSAIALADRDDPATPGDPAWKPVLPTPNHPEYPAAHACTAGGVAETLHQFFGTTRIAFSFDSTVTGTTRHYASLDAYRSEDQMARIAGGMHFRSSTADGLLLGTQVAQWTAARYFRPRR